MAAAIYGSPPRAVTNIFPCRGGVPRLRSGRGPAPVPSAPRPRILPVPPLRLVVCVVLLTLAHPGQSADLAMDGELASVLSIAEEGKLAHAIRAVDRLITAHPADTRLVALKDQLTRSLARDMPPQPSGAAPVGAVSAAPRPPVPSGRLPVPGNNFVCGTAAIAMIWIPAGSFVMSGIQGSDDDTEVTFSRGYWLGQTEVTQEQWQPLMEENPLPSYFKGSDRPVEWIGWVSAMDFCRKLTEREHAAGRLPDRYGYTLPTEAQWEYACRAGTTGPYAGDLGAMAWYEVNGGQQTHPVGQKQPNAWGLYDMHGNVWEWCLDSYGGYPGGHVVDPRPDPTTGPTAIAARMIRGGAWNSSAGQCRSATRHRLGLNYTGGSVGLRVALVPQSGPAPAGSPAAGPRETAR